MKLTDTFAYYSYYVIGYYIFAEVDPSVSKWLDNVAMCAIYCMMNILFYMQYFDSFKKSFVSLFVLMTTSK